MFYLFLFNLAAINKYDVETVLLLAYSSGFLFSSLLFYSSLQFFLLFYSFLLMLVVFKYFKNTATVFTFSSRPTNHCFSFWGFYLSYFFSSSQNGFFLYFFYLRQQSYRYSILCSNTPN